MLRLIKQEAIVLVRPLLVFLSFFLCYLHHLEASHTIEVSVQDSEHLLNLFASHSYAESTTRFRREQKAVLSDRSARYLVNAIKRPQHLGGLSLKRRDAIKPGKRNHTLTFYGKGLHLEARDHSAHLVMRARFYLNSNAVSKGSFERVASTRKHGWLELKLRNPQSGLPWSVIKLRVKLLDEDLYAMFHLNDSDDALATLDEIELRALSNFKNNKDAKVMFKVFRDIYLKYPDFFNDQFVVSYERVSYKANEKHYNEGQSEKLLPPVEYQFTIDRNIYYFQSDWNFLKSRQLLAHYFDENSRLFVGSYPHKLQAVEFKDPYPYAGYSVKSKVHQFFLDFFLKPLHSSEYRYLGVNVNEGKAAYFKRNFFAM